jgi:PIN domain nuclease of toxin-antitoxin system
VSVASAWEIATKVRIGKLVWPALAGSVNAYVLGQGFRALPISLEHAEHAGRLDIDHRDPFDRMLIAQAQAEDLWLVSNESIFDAAGVRRYW